MKKLLFLLLLATPFSQGGAQQLRFNANGEFKIVQFTDLHWNDRSPLCDSTAAMLSGVIACENPQLVVLTGDVVTAPPARDGWQRVAAIMAEARMPWTVTMGNHDGEAWDPQVIYGMLDTCAFFVGTARADSLTGRGNYVLEVKQHNGTRPAALLWCLDSHNKPPANKFGHYDWVHFDQIAWYRTVSRQFTAGNGSAPLPALMFLHIPLQEYAAAARGEHTGNVGGGIAASAVNSGLFASVLEMDDVMGIFAGHDHDNDFIGKHLDVALAYGRVSGLDADASLPRGARVITLREGEQVFDTWIRTPKGVESEYFYPSGITVQEEEDMEYLPATDVEPTEQGLEYAYFEGRRFSHTSDIAQAEVAARGKLDEITIVWAPARDSMAYVFTSWLKVPERGVYNFYTFSDDGSVLRIDGRTVVDNDGGHSLQRRDGKVALEAGFHRLELLYFENYMGQGLEVGWSSRRIRESPLPRNVLWRTATHQMSIPK